MLRLGQPALQIREDIMEKFWDNLLDAKHLDDAINSLYIDLQVS